MATRKKKTPEPVVEVEANENLLKLGEEARFDCNRCTREFIVVLEPKAKTAGMTGLKAAVVYHCPFCSSTSITRGV